MHYKRCVSPLVGPSVHGQLVKMLITFELHGIFFIKLYIILQEMTNLLSTHSFWHRILTLKSTFTTGRAHYGQVGSRMPPHGFGLISAFVKAGLLLYYSYRLFHDVALMSWTQLEVRMDLNLGLKFH